MYPPAGVLQRLRTDSLETQQSNLQTEKQPKGMAKPSSRGDATTWLTAPRKRAHRLHNSTRRCIHPMLRG